MMAGQNLQTVLSELSLICFSMFQSKHFTFLCCLSISPVPFLKSHETPSIGAECGQLVAVMAYFWGLALTLSSMLP